MAAGTKPKPFLILTPHGVDHVVCLAQHLHRLGVRITARSYIGDWSRISSALYLQVMDRQSLLQAAVYEKSWRRLSRSTAIAERWDLVDESDLERVAAAKQRLREECPTRCVRVTLSEGVFRLGLHAFHSPDIDRWPFEFACLNML